MNISEIKLQGNLLVGKSDSTLYVIITMMIISSMAFLASSMN